MGQEQSLAADLRQPRSDDSIGERRGNQGRADALCKPELIGERHLRVIRRMLFTVRFDVPGVLDYPTE